MKAEEWIAAYAERVGLPPPAADEVAEILDLAAEAAHASERVAAPVACWLGASAGLALAEALEIARGISAGDSRD